MTRFCVLMQHWNKFLFFFFFPAKEEEKQKLLKWSSDLKQEREQLEQKVKQLSSSISVSQPHALSDRYRDAALYMYVRGREALKG